jgi:phosphohistidine swiveling domain-containing protein
VLDGFDVVSPTLREQPSVIIGKLGAALRADPDAARNRADQLAADLRAQIPDESRAEFDELVDEARAVYRLRDERGIYSEVTAIGLLRRALLEVGNRLSDREVIDDPALMLEATPEEAAHLLGGEGPTGDDLAERGDLRHHLTAEGAPRHLGPPPPAPPPVDELPPALGRLMSSIGFMIESILGQLDASAGDDTVIQGIGVTDQICEGSARLVRSIDDLLDLEEGEVIVAPTTGEAFNSVLHLVAGIVTNHGSHACHAAIVAREVGFPAVVGTINATTRIKTGDRVRVDGPKGEVTLL